MNANWKWAIGGVVAIVVVGGIFRGVWVAKKNQESLTPPAENQNLQLEVPAVVASPTSETEVETTGKTVEVTVEGSSYKFSPATIKAGKGDTVRLTFKSTGGIHDLTIDELDVQTSQLGDGEEEEVEFVADKTGTFEYYCSVGNHRKMGMVGKLVVE